MKNFQKKDLTIFFIIFISVVTFFSFGLYHLAKFETVDEHFWKYDRIPRYWLDGILKKDLKKTYINDKPGITTAIISGIGLPFIQNPQEHRIREKEVTANDNYTVYDSTKTEKINFTLRLPLLIANSLLIIYLFWITKKVFQSNIIAAISTALIGLSPILIGISQIINPDTFLWSCGAGALLSYWAFLQSGNQRKYLFLTIAFTGATILAKYTGTILYLLFFISFFSHLICAKNDLPESDKFSKYVLKNIFTILLIIIGSAIIFSIGMPAVLIKIKYLYRGTIWSPAFKPLAIPLSVLIIAIITDLQFFKSKLTLFIVKFFRKNFDIFLRTISILTLILIVFIFINSWFGQEFIPMDNIREKAYFEKNLTFPMFSGDLLPISFFKKLAIETYPLPFSISPLALFFIIFILLRIILTKEINFKKYIFTILLLFPIYFIGSLISGVLLNPRYMILLYPFVFILAAISCFEIITLLQNTFYKKNRNIFIGIIIFSIFISGYYSLWIIKPFYFNYMSDLLPKNQLITDSWGYGSYEAAQYLNSLPEAEKIVIWADRSAICQFIKGKCIRDYKIDLTKTIPDYFVFTRRGQIRHQFIWDNPSIAKKSSFDYYNTRKTKNIWKFSIDKRADNFIRIVKSEEK